MVRLLITESMKVRSSCTSSSTYWPNGPLYIFPFGRTAQELNIEATREVPHARANLYDSCWTRSDQSRLLQVRRPPTNSGRSSLSVTFHPRGLYRGCPWKVSSRIQPSALPVGAARRGAALETLHENEPSGLPGVFSEPIFEHCIVLSV